MEHIGTITAAGQELSADKTKKIFKLHMDNPKYTYTLFDESQKMFAEENIGGAVKVVYAMSQDEKHRNVDTIEIASAEAVVAVNGRDAAIAHAVAIKEIGEDWRADKLESTDEMVLARAKWLREQMNVEKSIVPGVNPTPAPTYKDKEGDDVSNATTAQKEALKKMLGTPDDDEFTNAIRGRFGDEALQIKDLSKNEAGDWITELQKEDK